MSRHDTFQQKIARNTWKIEFPDNRSETVINTQCIRYRLLDLFCTIPERELNLNDFFILDVIELVLL